MAGGTQRRSLLKMGMAGGMLGMLPPLPLQAAMAASGRTPVATDDAEGGMNVTGPLVNWAMALRYEDLPADVVHGAKRFILDAVGCAHAGWLTDKGRRAAETILALGGTEDCSIWGDDRRISPASAAFVNAELMNALDYDAIPHTPPVTLPAIMALAESWKSSGKDLLLATVIAHEIAARLSAASSQMSSALIETGQTPEVFGINNEAIMAAAIAGARLGGLTAQQAAHACGLAGYYCPPQTSHDWETLYTKTNVKYTPVGWVSQGTATAVLLAKAGFTGNPAVLDGSAGFAKFYGWPAWQPERAVQGLDDEWRMLSVDYKPHAACRFIHSQIDCMEQLRARHRFAPDDIEAIETLGVPFVAHPDPMNVTTQEGAQFSTPYNIALAACGIPIDSHAQSEANMNSPAVLAMMQRIEWGVHPGSAAAKAKDPRSYIARVTVTLKDGRQLSEDALYPRGIASQPALRLSDEELNRKFAANAAPRIGRGRSDALAESIWSLDSTARFTPLDISGSPV